MSRALGLLLSVVVALLSLACGRDEPFAGSGPGSVIVVQPEAVDPVVDRSSAALSTYLEALTGVAPTVVRLPAGSDEGDVMAAAESERAGLVVVLDAHRLGAAAAPEGAVTALPGEGFRLVVEDRGGFRNRLDDSRGATIAWLAADTKLGKQYAVYELLRRLGARFYHPEQEWVPRLPAAQIRRRARAPTLISRVGSDGKPQPDHVADFAARSYTFHGSHPLEHLEAFSDASFPIDEAVHVNDWIVKNRGNRFRGAGRGIASDASRKARAAELDALRRELGFPAGAGITLHNQQQGANAVVDPTLPVPARQQIENYVAAQLAGADDDVTSFGIHFGPTEFTVTPDVETVQWIDWAGQKALELRPDIEVQVNDHITGSQPTPNFDDLGCPPGTNDEGRGDYYDLAFHADPRFATKVHTVMFYPLEGPAHVYNQVSFAHKLCLMKQASAAGRPLEWFPEGSWWLSFDNSIPVYLPLYIWARKRDVDLLAPLLPGQGGTLGGHRMFNSGHEWGYWQQDYAVGIWHWRADAPLSDVVAELVDPLCDPARWPKSCGARDTTQKVLLELMDHQRDYLLERPRMGGKAGGLFTYLAGEDPADELAAATGLEFRPVRTSFSTVLGWDKKQLGDFRFSDQKRLIEMQEVHADWLQRLEAVRLDVPKAGLPWFDEIVDGVEINLLRAEQAERLYDAVLAYREDQLKQQADPSAPDPKIRAGKKLELAAQTLARAEQVIRRREAAYRYPPAQTHGGGLTPETAVENGTTYPFRVHTKTHLLTYWNNRHELAKQIVEGGGPGGNVLVLDPVLAPPGAALGFDFPSIDGLTATLTLGDGGTADETTTSHDYPTAEAVYPIGGQLDLAGTPLPVSGRVVRAERRAAVAKDGFYLAQPDSDLARSVLSPLVPRLHFAWVPGTPAQAVLIPDTRIDGRLDFQRVSAIDVASESAGNFLTKPFSLSIPISPPGTGEVTLEVRVTGATLSGSVTPTAFGEKLTLKGEMLLEDIVAALIALAGFDQKGALETLSGILGFDPDAPPKSVPFEAHVTVEPSP